MTHPELPATLGSIETVVLACCEMDDLPISIQLTHRALETLRIAQGRLGPQIRATFIRWRVRRNVLFLAMGLDNLKDGDPSPDSLKYKEDLYWKIRFVGSFYPSEWYREGRYATIVSNSRCHSIIARCWGANSLVDFLR